MGEIIKAYAEHFLRIGDGRAYQSVTPLTIRRFSIQPARQVTQLLRFTQCCQGFTGETTPRQTSYIIEVMTINEVALPSIFANR